MEEGEVYMAGSGFFFWRVFFFGGVMEYPHTLKAVSAKGHDS